MHSGAKLSWMARSFSLNSLAHNPPWLLLRGCILPRPLPLPFAEAVQPPGSCGCVEAAAGLGSGEAFGLGVGWVAVQPSEPPGEGSLAFVLAHLDCAAASGLPAACFGCGVATSAGAGAPCGVAACLGVASALGGGPSAFAGAACAWAALAAGAFAVAAGAPAPAGAATASVGAACATATASARLGAVLSAAGSSFSFSPHHPWLSSPLPDHPQLLPQSCHQLMAPQGFSVCGVLGLRAPQTAAVI